jgi:hypothetical protein
LARPCAKCGKPLSGTVAEWEGYNPDVVVMFLKILNFFVQTKGVAYHTACFGCSTCAKPLRSECVNINGKP